ncbi:MAG: glycosyltransferase family 4 protein [Actinomycetes bacterium]
MSTPSRERPWLLLDDRSAYGPHTTGWERVARAIRDLMATRPGVRTLGRAYAHPSARVMADWLVLPRAARGVALAHTLSFPPTPALRRAAGRTLFTVHDLTWWRYPELSSRLGRLYYRRVAAAAIADCDLLVPTETVRAEVIAELGVTPDRVTAVPWGVTPIADVAPAKRPRPYVLALGTREPRKNLAILVEAYRRSGLSGTHDLVLAGRRGWGPDDPPGVVVVDAPTDEHLGALLRGAAALASPSLYEGFGLPLLEAFSVGRPVVCSDIPVFREVTAGLAEYADPRDPDGFAAALVAVARDGRHAPAKALVAHAATYTWSRAAAELLALYARLVPSAPGVGQ